MFERMVRKRSIGVYLFLKIGYYYLKRRNPIRQSGFSKVGGKTYLDPHLLFHVIDAIVYLINIQKRSKDVSSIGVERLFI